MKQFIVLLAVLLASVPTVLADYRYPYYYGSGNGYGYGSGYGGDGYGESGIGRSYQSYSRTYDTSKSDISSHTISNNGNNQDAGYGYPPISPYGLGGGGYGSGYGSGDYGMGGVGPGNWYSYQSLPSNYVGYGVNGRDGPGGYTNAYTNGYIPPYYPPYPSLSRSSSNSFTDNYNRAYNEHTNENIKVDNYIRYDNLGVVHLTAGDIYGGRRPYYVTLDNNYDPYTSRYPYSGQSTSDRGYFAQPYYTNSAVGLPPQPAVQHAPSTPFSSMQYQPLSVPSIRRYSSSLQVASPSLTGRQTEGPSQGYQNQITDRGPLYAPMMPASGAINAMSRPATGAGSSSALGSESSNGSIGSMRGSVSIASRGQLMDNQIDNQAGNQPMTRNPTDRSIYDGNADRDSLYVYPYQEGLGRR